MHSRVSWWTEKSILWYERASSSSDFHQRLSDLIEPALSKDERILEAGCGLGYEAEILSIRGYDIRGYDKEPLVIEAAKARSSLDIFRCEDFYKSEESPDVLLCINFGHLDKPEDLESLLSQTRRKLVCIVSRHSGHGVRTRKDRSDLIESLLEGMGLEYEREDFTLSFDQPLVSLEEARDFIEWTYLGDRVEAYLDYVEKTEDKDFPFVFRNRKKMVKFLINK